MAQQLTALYVEDDDSTFFLVQTALSEANLPVELVRAADGDQALRILTETNNATPGHGGNGLPDVVLLDLNLPRVSGFDVLAEASRVVQRLPFYVLTTSASPRDRERSLRLGATDFFTKPATFDGLMTLLQSIFQPNQFLA